MILIIPIGTRKLNKKERQESIQKEQNKGRGFSR